VKDIIRDSNKYLSEEAAAKTITADSFTQMCNRARKKDKEDEDLIDNEGLLCDLILPESLQRTYKNIIFYFDDSGPKDKARVIVFTPEQN
jgi:hypothetical protein